MRAILFTPLVFLSLLLFSSCSKDSATIDPPLGDPPPSFKALTLSRTLFDTDTLSVTPGRDKSPDDPVTIAFTLAAHTSAESSGQAERIMDAASVITVDGKTTPLLTLPLSSTGGGVFTGSIALPLRRGDVGDYRVTVTGRTADGLEASPIFTRITVLAGARPPHFCGITAPDSIDLPASGFTILSLQACVQDSSGLADIKRVLFNSYLPNGQPSSGNPFLMHDDGTSGDVTAGDGIYTLDVQLPSTAQKGKYRFEFFAYDLGNLNAFTAKTIIVR